MCLVQNPSSVHKLTREQQTMDIAKNLGPELEEYQQQPPVTINHQQISLRSNDYLRRNQQDESDSSSSTIRPSNEGSSRSNIKSSHEGNQRSYFRPSNDSNQSSTSAVVEPVIDTGEEDKSVKEEEEEMKDKEKSKGEQSVDEEDEDYIQVEDDKSYQSHVSNKDYIMSPSSCSSSSSHHDGRGGRGSSSHHGGRGGSSSHHSGRGGRGSSRHHDGQRGRHVITRLTTQDQLNELTCIQANLGYQMSDFIGKLGRELEEEKDGELSTSQTQLCESHLALFQVTSL